MLWGDAGDASVVAVETWTIAIDRAWTAWEIELYTVVGTLVPAEETGVAVRRAPNGDDGTRYETCKVHVGRVHGHHHVEVRHEDKFLVETVEKR